MAAQDAIIKNFWVAHAKNAHSTPMLSGPPPTARRLSHAGRKWKDGEGLR